MTLYGENIMTSVDICGAHCLCVVCVHVHARMLGFEQLNFFIAGSVDVGFCCGYIPSASLNAHVFCGAYASWVLVGILNDTSSSCMLVNHSLV